MDKLVWLLSIYLVPLGIVLVSTAALLAWDDQYAARPGAPIKLQVLQDNAQGQSFIYRHALESIRIDLNGAVFASTRRPDPAQEIIAINVFNLTAPPVTTRCRLAFRIRAAACSVTISCPSIRA